MKRFLNSVLCMCIAVFCTHAQKKNVTSVLEVYIIVEENYISSLRNLRESRN